MPHPATARAYYYALYILVQLRKRAAEVCSDQMGLVVGASLPKPRAASRKSSKKVRPLVVGNYLETKLFLAKYV